MGRKSFIYMVLFISLLCLTCSDDSGKTDTVNNKELIKFAVPSWMLDWSEKQVDGFMTENPQYEVELIEIVSGPDMNTKMTMMMQSSKTCPDVIDEDGFMINGDVAAGYLEPIEPLLAGWDGLSQFVPSLLNGARGENGKLYAIPFSTDTQGIWYNKSLFTQAGISIPWQPANWDEILEAAEKLKAVGEDPDFIPLFLYAAKPAVEPTSMRTFQVLYFGTGGELYNAEESKWIVDKVNLKKVFNFINDVYNVKSLGAPLSIVAQANAEDLFLSDYMKNEKLGLLFSGNWITNNWGKGQKYEWPEALDVWGFATVPTDQGQSPGFVTMSGGWTWAIPALATNKSGGAELVKYLASKDVQLNYALERRDLAVRKDVMADDRYINQEMSVVKQTVEQLKYAHFRPSVDGYATLTTMFTEVVEGVSMGLTTPEEAVAMFEREMIRIVGKDNVIIK